MESVSLEHRRCCRCCGFDAYATIRIEACPTQTVIQVCEECRQHYLTLIGNDLDQAHADLPYDQWPPPMTIVDRFSWRCSACDSPVDLDNPSSSHFLVETGARRVILKFAYCPACSIPPLNALRLLAAGSLTASTDVVEEGMRRGRELWKAFSSTL